MNKILLALLTIVSSGFAASAADITDVLRAIEINNLSLRSLAAGGRADSLEIKESGLPDGPSVEYSPFYRKGAAGVASSELVVSQEFDFPTLYFERGKARRYQYAAISAGYELARRDLLLDACLKCLDYIRLRDTGRMMERRIAMADTLLALYQRRFDNGDATILDLNRIKLEQMDLRTAIVSLRSEADDIALQLRAMNADMPLDLDSLSYPAPGSPFLASAQSGLSTADDKSVKAARAALSASERNVRVSSRQWLPKISIGYRRNTEMEHASNGFLIGASIPIWSASTGVRAAKARAVQSQLELDDAIAGAEAEITSQTNRLASLSSAMQAYDISLMEQTLALMAKSVDHGSMSVTDYYTEADKIYEKWQNYLQIRNDYYQTLVRLNKNSL